MHSARAESTISDGSAHKAKNIDISTDGNQVSLLCSLGGKNSGLVAGLIPGSYLILLSRQGKVVRAHRQSQTPQLATNPSAETRKVVHYTVTEGEGKDHQGCLATRAGTADEDVQFSGVQRLVVPRLCRPFAKAPLPDSKIVYRRYASLFFIAGCASTDNELITLEIVHRYVEQMDKYYGNVCEVRIPLPEIKKLD